MNRSRTTTRTRSFIPAEVFYEGLEWYRVGVRFKGNSSLQSSWQNGILKPSLKLDFDELEDDDLQTDNQRFYGFKKLSFLNNYQDSTMLREKVAGDVFRDMGLPGSNDPDTGRLTWMNRDNNEALQQGRDHRGLRGFVPEQPQ